MIAKLYLSCSVQLNLSKEICEIDYKIGVQIADNVALILFLYIMQEAIKTLDAKLPCTQENITVKQQYGCLSMQPEIYHENKCPFQVNNLLYADNGAFLLKHLMN